MYLPVLVDGLDYSHYKTITVFANISPEEDLVRRSLYHSIAFLILPSIKKRKQTEQKQCNEKFIYYEVLDYENPFYVSIFT